MNVVVEALLVPVVTAALGALGLALQERRIRRDAVNRRARALADATAQATFVEHWWRMLREVNGPEPAKPDDVAKARAMLAEAVETVFRSPAPEASPDGRPGTLRRLFLLYRLRTRRARIVRWTYHFWLLLVLAVYVGQTTEKVSGESRWANAASATAALALFLLPAASLRALALFLDNRIVGKPSEGRSG